MNKFTTVIVVVLVALVVLFLVGFLATQQSPKPNPALDTFAQCLASKGATMYGAYWCPHCQNEKKAFGDSFKYITYVECTQETQKCLDKGIEGYPTWIFEGNRKFVGEQGLEGLSKISGCPLNLGTQTGFSGHCYTYIDDRGTENCPYHRERGDWERFGNHTEAEGQHHRDLLG